MGVCQLRRGLREAQMSVAAAAAAVAGADGVVQKGRAS